VADEARQRGFAAPSIIVVGGVCGLHDKLAWFEKRPLLGKGVVVTRAREQASSLVRTLAGHGAHVYEFPTIRIQPLDGYEEVENAILRLPMQDWVIFTSVNGVKHFWNQLQEIGLDARVFGGLQVAAIGPATAEALRCRGINPDFVPEKYVAEHVVSGLLERGIAGKKVLIPRARVAREVLPQELVNAGAEVQVLPVYETTLAQEDESEIIQAMDQDKLDYVTFTSSSTVDNFFTLVDADRLREYKAAHPGKAKLACIGPITAQTLQKHGFEPDLQPEDYTIPALVDALLADR
jgi:uroporphyrinogen III methyltransferase/synthase